MGIFFLAIILFVFLFLFYRKRKIKSEIRKTFFIMSIFSLILLLMNIYQAYSYRHNVHEVYGCLEKILKGRFGGYKIKVNGIEEVFKGSKYGDFFMKEEYVGTCFNIKYYDFIISKNIIMISDIKE